jgi:pyruvate/2-oxoglutarate dehydrogenase complex dihydrolipoamide dehydrogenase (E3) component
VEGAARLLGRTEPWAGEMVADALRQAGVQVLLGRSATGCSRPGVKAAPEGYIRPGEVTVSLDDGTELTADEVLVAAGRSPNSADLGLESIDVETTGGYIAVDQHMGVPGRDWLYVVGDLCGKALLTHMGKYQARVAGDVIAARAAGLPLDGERFRDLADDAAVPQVTFTDPEVGSVGLTEAASRERGLDVEVVEYDLAQVAGASLLRDGYQGRANLVIDRARDVVVGATFVGNGVAELVHSATVAVVGEVPVSRLWHAVPSYPTVSEVWLRLLETLRQQRG